MKKYLFLYFSAVSVIIMAEDIKAEDICAHKNIHDNDFKVCNPVCKKAGMQYVAAYGYNIRKCSQYNTSGSFCVCDH